MLTVAFVVSAHGYGHASREMEVVRTLLERRPGLSASILSAAPEGVFHNHLAHPAGAHPAARPRAGGDVEGGCDVEGAGLWQRVSVVPYRADVGVVQRDGLAFDEARTLTAIAERWGDPERAVAELAGLLAPLRPAVVVADVPPVAFAAARRLGVPSIAVANFDWAFIYGYYARRSPAFADVERLCLRWQGEATLAAHLAPGPPLGGFREVVDVPPIGRQLDCDPAATRARLRIPPGDRAVLVSFGGFGLSDAGQRLPRLPGVTWVLAPPMPDLGRADTRFADADPYVALVAACDAVFTKPGYGIITEAARQRTRLLYTDRGDFPEYPWLVRWLDDNVPSVHVPSVALGTEAGAAAIARGLDALFALPDRFPEEWSGADRVADLIERYLPAER